MHERIALDHREVDVVTDDGWFVDLAPDAIEDAAIRIRDGRADEPADWPARAVEAGFAADESAYYDRLHAAALAAVRTSVAEHEEAPDQQLIHSVRAMADLDSASNELAERVAEWAASWFDDAGTGVEYARELAATEPEGPVEERLVALARCVATLDAERDALQTFIEREAPTVAPNLSGLAGPVLAARLIALAGGLESLAKKPSGTVQVLGAEDALFAHLRGQAPSPKHGIIFTHEYVRGMPPAKRGPAARTLAGKLAIAARIDHYSGERNPDLDAELRARMEHIRERGDA